MITYQYIKKLLDDNSDLLRTCMNTRYEIEGVLRKLADTINNDIPGDVVELGCNDGGTSMWIQLLLTKYAPHKSFHVYDSWEGVPQLGNNDRVKLLDDIGQVNMHGTYLDGKQIYKINQGWNKGACMTSMETFIMRFNRLNIKMPIIHSGWFAEITEYPSVISFAFFDGDVYSSITDSFNMVYDKVSPGGIIVIDDCGDKTLPGVKSACLDFLSTKKETLQLDAYPSIDGKWERDNYNVCYWGGWIYKL